MKKLLSLGILCASVIAAPLAVRADTLNGSDTINLNGTTSIHGGSNIDNATSISWTAGTIGSTGLGDLAAIPSNAIVSAGSYTYGSDAITITIAGWGTFTGTGGTQTISGPFVLLSFASGLFTPVSSAFDTALGTPGVVYTANAASLNFAFSQTGNSIGGSGTLTTPPNFVPPPPPGTVPEPSSLALLGTGLLTGVGFLRRRTA